MARESCEAQHVLAWNNKNPLAMLREVQGKEDEMYYTSEEQGAPTRKWKRKPETGNI